VDYQIGATAILTAANIAAAITNLTGFTAANNGTATVSIEYDIGMAHKIEFRVEHYGQITNLTTITPADGEMALGSPEPGAVDIA